MKIFPATWIAALATATVAACMPAAAIAQEKPLATRALDTEGITAEVLESVRKDGLLTVRVRFRNTTDKPIKFKLVHSGRYDANYISAGDTKYMIMRDAKKNVVATPTDGGGWIEPTIKAKGTFGWWAKFPAPPPERKTYTLYLSVGPPIEDVPIVDKP
jgi:hypothetical protein